MARYTIHPDGTITPPLLTPAEVAEIVAVDQANVRRWVRSGECPDAGLPGATVRVPAWWVTDRIAAGRLPSAPAEGVVALAERGPAVAVPHGTNGGGTHPRTVPEVAPSGAA